MVCMDNFQFDVVSYVVGPYDIDLAIDQLFVRA